MNFDTESIQVIRQELETIFSNVQPYWDDDYRKKFELLVINDVREVIDQMERIFAESIAIEAQCDRDLDEILNDLPIEY